jgi:hypothetical protein
MKIIKRAAGKILSALGYEVRRSGADPTAVRYENFLNLTTAFEACLNDGHTRILPNKTRPMLLGRLLGTPPSEGYFIIEALYKCRDVRGDICEFGVAQGETSALMANEIKDLIEKRLHLFDSFEGLPKPTDKDQLKDDIFSLGSMDAYTGTMSCPEEMVHRRLNAISFPSARYVIHKGWVEELIRKDQHLPKEVSFAYVDLDFYGPVKSTLEFLDSVTRKGSIIIVDDYDFFSTGVKTAVDEFVNSRRSIPGSDYDCVVPDARYGHFAVLSRRK